jgi:hypothetical protein
MARDWKLLKAEIERESAAGLEDCPDDILRVFEYDIVPTGAGTGGQIFALWYEGANASRYLGPYYIYNVIKLANHSKISVKKIKQLLNLMMPKALGTVALSGMETFARFTKETLECVKEMESRDDILSLLNALYLYGSNVNAWQNYRIKWGLGMAFPIPAKAELLKLGERAGESYR